MVEALPPSLAEEVESLEGDIAHSGFLRETNTDRLKEALNIHLWSMSRSGSTGKITDPIGLDCVLGCPGATIAALQEQRKVGYGEYYREARELEVTGVQLYINPHPMKGIVVLGTADPQPSLLQGFYLLDRLSSGIQGALQLMLNQVAGERHLGRVFFQLETVRDHTVRRNILKTKDDVSIWEMGLDWLVSDSSLSSLVLFGPRLLDGNYNDTMIARYIDIAVKRDVDLMVGPEQTPLQLKLRRYKTDRNQAIQALRSERYRRRRVKSEEIKRLHRERLQRQASP